MGNDSWWDWRLEPSQEDMSAVTELGRRVLFEELTERCVVVDNMATHASCHTVRTALGQYGTVVGVKIVVSLWDMKSIGVAIVEMSSKNERDQVVRELTEYLFMLAAMPRPARAIPATAKLLLDHPLRRNPNIITPRVIRRDDPEATILREREKKDLLKMDDDKVLQSMMEQEEMRLAKSQELSYQESVEKLYMIAGEHISGTILELKRLHGFLR